MARIEFITGPESGFTRFFLTTCIDQVSSWKAWFSRIGFEPAFCYGQKKEIRLNHLPPKSGSVLEAVLYRGELPRGDAAGVVGTGERQARHVVSALIDHGVLVSESPRASLRLAFPAAFASRWLPGLVSGRTE